LVPHGIACEVLSNLLTYINSLSMVPFSYSDHQLLLSTSTFANCCCHFFMLQLRMWMLYLSHYVIMTHSHFDTWHHNKISKARRANEMTCDSKLLVRLTLEDFPFATFFQKTHLSHMTTSEESLRVLFFTCSLTVDLVH
jgi:hypothetical protein